MNSHHYCLKRSEKWQKYNIAQIQKDDRKTS